jgi:hypothetical protein
MSRHPDRLDDNSPSFIERRSPEDAPRPLAPVRCGATRPGPRPSGGGGPCVERSALVLALARRWLTGLLSA